MLYNFLLYIQQLLGFLLSGASAIPFLIALGLIIGRRGHAAFCLFGSRKAASLAIGLAWAGLFYFPLNYLMVVLPYGLQKSVLSSIFSPQGRPWLAAFLCWCAGIFILFLAAKSLRGLRLPSGCDRYQFRFIRGVFLLFGMASLAFLIALFLEHWPFAGLPEGMSAERAVLAIARNSMRRFFQAFSPAGALGLLYATWFFKQPSSKKFSEEKAGSLRWFAFWALAGAVPSLFISWGLQLLAWNSSAAPGLGNSMGHLPGLLFQTLAIGGWVWIICRPGKSSWRIVLTFILMIFYNFWPLIIRLA